MKISVVVPVHNEVNNVEALIEEIHQSLLSMEAYEMIFVDDGSTDETVAKLEFAMSNYPTLRVMRHSRSCGQSRAIHTGIVASQYSWIVTLDGDGQNDPRDIFKLIEVVKRRQDSHLWMVTGHRLQRLDSSWRRFSSKIANYVRQAILNDHNPDTGCGLKLFRREKFLDLPYFDHIHRFLPALIQMAGGQVDSVEVSHRSRQSGQSKYGTWDRLAVGVVDLFGVVWLKNRHSLPEITEVHRG